MIRADDGTSTDDAVTESRRQRSARKYREALLVVGGLAVAAAVGAAFAGCHPTGTAVMDVLYPAALAALVTVAASKSSRYQLLWLTVIAFGLSRSWLWIPAGVALALAFVSVFQARPRRRMSALIGALAVEAVLRWPSGGFHGFTAIAAAVAITPVLFSGWRHCSRRLRRRLLIGGGSLIGLGLLFSLPVAVSALISRHPAEQGISLAKSSLTQIEAAQAPAATAQLRLASADLAIAKERMTGWWNLGGFLVPVVAQQERALYHGTTAGADLTAVASRQAGALDLQALRYRGGRIDLEALEALQRPATALDSAIISAQAELAGTSSPWLVSPLSSKLGDLQVQLGKARSATDLATLATQDLPSILGSDGIRHYLVAFMTPAETRGLGGFIGAYGVLTVDNGSVHLTTAGSTIQLEATANSGVRLVAPPDYVARYGRFSPQDRFQDLTYSPDFPSVEQAIAGVYPQVGGSPVDGVIALDPYALGALLNFTGPISVPGLAGQLTPANAADVLIRQQYLSADAATSQRHDLLQAALQTGFGRLTSGSLPSPKSIATVLGPEVQQGRLLFWTNHPDDAPLLQRLGLTGAFPHVGPSSDLLAVTVANAGNDKIDAYLHQQVADAVSYDPTSGHVHSTVTVHLQNSAPSTGMTPYVIGNSTGLPPGTNYLWLSLYSPLHLVGASLDGASDGLSSSTEDGVNVYSTYITIPAGSSSTLTVTMAGALAPGSGYQMTLRQQPLANPQSYSVTVAPPAGWLYRSGIAGPWAAGAAEVQRHTWSFVRSTSTSTQQRGNG